MAVNKATSFLPECFRDVGNRVTADQPGPLQLSTGFPTMTPLNMTPVMSWQLSPHFTDGTDESVRLQSHFNSLSPYSRLATPPRLPAQPVCVCL